VESERSKGKKTAEQLQVAIKAQGEKNLVSRSIICFTYTHQFFFGEHLFWIISTRSRSTSVAVILKES
jgi:hypothetical protein